MKRWRRNLAVAASGVLLTTASLLTTTSGVQANTAGVEHLPDLQTQPPSGFRIDTSSGQKLARFDNTVVNMGDGRLELRPQSPSWLSGLLGSTGTIRVYQGIFTHNAAGTWTRVRERLAGTMTYHPTHGHWHFEKFALYQLFSVAPDGSRGSSLNRVSEKTTFCIIDTTRISTTIEHAEGQRYVACGRTSTTGISVGWGDTYHSGLDGQWIDVTGLPDGPYWVVSTADYAGRIQEKDESNNEAAVKIQITGNTVTVIS